MMGAASRRGLLLANARLQGTRGFPPLEYLEGSPGEKLLV